MKVFANRLKKLREEKGLSQRELAKYIGIAHSILGSIPPHTTSSRKTKKPPPEGGGISREIFLSKLFSPLVPESIFELTSSALLL